VRKINCNAKYEMTATTKIALPYQCNFGMQIHQREAAERERQEARLLLSCRISFERVKKNHFTSSTYPIKLSSSSSLDEYS
jgi:hypothetical protein